MLTFMMSDPCVKILRGLLLSDRPELPRFVGDSLRSL